MGSHDTLIRLDTLIIQSRTGSEPTKNILEVMTHHVYKENQPGKNLQTL
jgi:hypothetical protein